MKAHKYPNLDAIMAGAVSGHFTEWPMVRVELTNLITEFEAEAAALAATACEKPQSDERGHTFCAKDVEIARLRTYVEELRQVVFDVVKWNEAYKEPLLGPIALIDRARAALAKNPDSRLQSCRNCGQPESAHTQDGRQRCLHPDGTLSDDCCFRPQVGNNAEAVIAPARELLFLYDWRFELASREKDHANVVGVSDNAQWLAEGDEIKRLLREYGERKKAGWIALRAALDSLHVAGRKP